MVRGKTFCFCESDHINFMDFCDLAYAFDKQKMPHNCAVGCTNRKIRKKSSLSFYGMSRGKLQPNAQKVTNTRNPKKRLEGLAI